MAGAVHHQIGAEAADDVAHARDALLRVRDRLDVDRRLGAELSREFEPRRLRRADANHATGSHLARGGDGENADWPRALNYHRVAPGEAAGAGRAVERADAGGERLRERPGPQRE